MMFFSTIFCSLWLHCMIHVRNVRSQEQHENSSCSQGGTPTFREPADIARLAAQCPTFTGDITIGYRDFYSDPPSEVVLDGLEVLEGSLRIADANVTRIRSSTLHTVRNKLYIQELEVLEAAPDLPNLRTVDRLVISGLPMVTTLPLMSHLTNVSSIAIFDTAIEKIYGPYVPIANLTDIVVSGNNFLREFVMYGDKVGSLIADGVGKVQLPNLRDAETIDINGCPIIELPVLEEVTGDLSLWGDNGPGHINGAGLHSVGGSLMITEFDQNLTDVPFPNLAVVNGSISVTENAEMKNIRNLTRLQSVGTYLRLYGSFESAISVPALTSVGTSINFSSDKAVSCDFLVDLAANVAIGESISCYTATDSVYGSLQDDRSYIDDGTASSNQHGEGGPSSLTLILGITIPVAIVVLLLIGCSWRISRQKRKIRQNVHRTPGPECYRAFPRPDRSLAGRPVSHESIDPPPPAYTAPAPPTYEEAVSRDT